MTEAIADANLSNHAIICGFGVPGRAVAEWLESHDLPYVVVETNATVCDRAGKRGRFMLEGDAREPEILRAAGIESAGLLIVAIPNDQAGLGVIEEARKLNSKLRIIARMHYISAGIEAKRLGADIAIIEEQVVGQELVRILENAETPRTK
ncbi:MAG: NAD-binding protein [Phycisphaerae bacterium]|nr:NAD-binding protein [Phycisphaerae bacterium]